MNAAEQPLDRARGALIGTFVGDALGMPYEGCSPEAPPRPLDMVDARLGRGTYTDDTQMMIALAESLIARGRVDPGHLARAFLVLYPRQGRQAREVRVDDPALRAAAALASSSSRDAQRRRSSG